MDGVFVAVADHLGWAVVVTATSDHRVVDRRRIELLEPGLPAAPLHHLGGAHAMHADGEPLDDTALASVIDEVRASVVRATGVALDDLVDAVGEIASLALRRSPADFPTDIATLRRVPYESRADPVMYGRCSRTSPARGGGR